MVDVRGKWALITGASRGIGRLIALFLAERGCNLVLHGRSAAHLEGVLAEVRILGVEAHGVGAELADPDQVTELLRQVDALQVQIDFVFNNAGVQAAYRTDYFTTPVSDFTQSFQINTIAPAMICYHFLPGMMERGFGRILNTTSVISVLPAQRVADSGAAAAVGRLRPVVCHAGDRGGDGAGGGLGHEKKPGTDAA